MKLFIDTANIDEIEQTVEYGILDGVTTNPTLLSREKKDPVAQLKKICDIVKGPVSAEVIGLSSGEMVEQARELADIADNIVIKIPCVVEGLKAAKELAAAGIQTNLTLCFSPSQALLVAKAGASYVSPFIGRLDDISAQGMDLIEEIRVIYDNYGIKTEIIAASIRHPLHFVDAAKIGADVATVPFSVIAKLMEHPLTDIGIKKFIEDWNNLKS